MADTSDPMQFSLQPSDLGFVGRGLVRPECVLCTAAGDIYVSHAQSGVTRIRPDGRQTDYRAPGEPEIKVNGFAIARNGDFLVANLDPPGGVWRITRDGGREPFLMDVGGRPLPAANFVMVDGQERVWASFSTWLVPRGLAYKPAHADGFIVLADGKGVGRRFDFLAQEFNREANTLCSKSGDVALTRVGLDLKVAVDQLREQVQNVE